MEQISKEIGIKFHLLLLQRIQNSVIVTPKSIANKFHEQKEYNESGNGNGNGKGEEGTGSSVSNSNSIVSPFLW
jgi:hypothetical protein